MSDEFPPREEGSWRIEEPHCIERFDSESRESTTLKEECFFLTGEGEIEATGFEEFFRRGDGHDFEDAKVVGLFDAGEDEMLSDADSASTGRYGEASDLGQFSGVDFQGGTSDDSIADEREVAIFHEGLQF